MKIVEGNSRLLVGDIELEIFHKGSGRAMLLLHGSQGLNSEVPFLTMLTREFEVIAPSHPGFGHSPLPERFDSINDLAYLYLDLIEQLKLHDVIIVGFSLGAWIGAEIAVRCAHNLERLILVAPLGIKIGDRESRDIPDIFALPPDEVNKLSFHDPTKGAVDYSALSDEELRTIARNRESLTLYTWEPYMHNPKLRYRLGRIRVSTLIIRGASDGIVSQTYAEAYTALIPGARLQMIPNAGHFPYIEQPQRLFEAVVEFARD